MDRGIRRLRTTRIINKRLKLVKQFFVSTEHDRISQEPNRLSKKHPMDCGHSRCTTCHYEKIYGIEKAKYKVVD